MQLVIGSIGRQRRFAPRASFAVIAVIVVGVVLAAVPARAQFAIDWFTIDGGGGTSTGGVYQLSATVGQPDTGVASGGSYTLTGGFWSMISTVPTPGAPELSIQHTPGGVVVSWPRPATGFLLQRASFLNAPPGGIPWGTIPEANYQTNATHIFLSVPAPMGNQFYRLRKS